MGKKRVKTVSLAPANKGRIQVKIAKKFTKKKKLKVRAVFTPSDSVNVIGAASSAKVIKAKK